MHWQRLAPLIFLAFAGCEQVGVRGAVATEGESVPLYNDLGDHSYGITTTDPVVQQYFDQGLRLSYAFNHAEAIRAFTEAARLDPDCAMCYWGVAYANGPNINAAMDSLSGVAAYEAIQEAMRLAPSTSPIERDLIAAMRERYAAVPTADRAALDSAYAAAMGELARRYPSDAEVLTLHAEALMDLSPWYYWNPDGSPRDATSTILANLEGVISRAPNHPGACHFYIHAVEAAEPEKAVACAERLAGLMPGAGHLVHMPGHIYIRVGRYMDAIRANEHAVHADETFIQDQRPGTNTYVLGYYPHNYDFLAFAAAMAGREQQALDAARRVTTLIPEELLREPGMAFLQQGLTGDLRTMVRFGRWDEILAAPEIPEDLPYARGTWHFARGMAASAKGDAAMAEAELARLRLISELPELTETTVGFNPASEVLRVATGVLGADVAERRGDFEAAITLLRAAAAVEDAFIYGEPPDWSVPVRHNLGAALLAAGRAGEAERSYREDLRRFPENGWSLAGLEQSLRAQGRTAAADSVKSRFDATWANADIGISGSRF